MLTIAQREEAVRNGLGDREGSVRKAAAAMLGGWLDQAEGNLVEVGHNESLSRKKLTMQFLARFDVVTSQVAEEALLSVFVTRPEVLDSMEFGGKPSPPLPAALSTAPPVSYTHLTLPTKRIV